jgi:hypothetical protein
MRRVVWWSAVVVAAALMAPCMAQGAGGSDWHPNAKGGLDCNGYSPVQKTYRKLWCTEIAANDESRL